MPMRRSLRRLGGPALVLLAAACARTQVSTYRWGGRGAPGAYLVDMGGLKRSGPRVDFAVVFIPAADPAKPEMAGIYVRAQHWIDCARGLKFESGQEAYSTSGARIPTPSDADAEPSIIAPDSTFGSVRDLVCTGRNDLDATPLTGTDAQAATQARAYMAAHPLEP